MEDETGNSYQLLPTTTVAFTCSHADRAFRNRRQPGSGRGWYSTRTGGQKLAIEPEASDQESAAHGGIGNGEIVHRDC